MNASIFFNYCKLKNILYYIIYQIVQENSKWKMFKATASISRVGFFKKLIMITIILAESDLIEAIMYILYGFDTSRPIKSMLYLLIQKKNYHQLSWIVNKIIESDK